jgi:hypothetical protein
VKVPSRSDFFFYSAVEKSAPALRESGSVDKRAVKCDEEAQGGGEWCGYSVTAIPAGPVSSYFAYSGEPAVLRQVEFSYCQGPKLALRVPRELPPSH